MLRLVGSLTLTCLALMAIHSAAQNPAVLDTDGQPLQSGVEYYVLPAATDTAGGLTLVNRTGSCPLYVAQEPLSTVVSRGYPVTFTPYVAGETTVREGESFTITFSAASTCAQSTAWAMGDVDTETNRRLIVAGEGENYSQYFKIGRTGELELYSFAWCPADVCPTCRFVCGDAGILVENGRRLLALDGSAFPFRFIRALTRSPY